MVVGLFLDFLDPSGNRVAVVERANVQCSKADHVQQGMHLALKKNPKAIDKLAAKGMAPVTGTITP